MKQQLWHVAWSTFGEWPPHDSRGDWSKLSESYAPLIAKGLVAPSRPLPAQYLVKTAGMIVRLSKDDAEFLREQLRTLTKDGDDRVAGGHQVLADAFRPTQAHVLLCCERETLSQVVGRIKSRLASLLLGEPNRSKSHGSIWGGGYWTAELCDRNLERQAREFVESFDP